MAWPLQRLATALRARDVRRKAESFLVHRPARRAVSSTAVAPGVRARVRALPWPDFVATL
jgi:hypothetical protein